MSLNATFDALHALGIERNAARHECCAVVYYGLRVWANGAGRVRRSNSLVAPVCVNLRQNETASLWLAALTLRTSHSRTSNRDPHCTWILAGEIAKPKSKGVTATTTTDPTCSVQRWGPSAKTDTRLASLQHQCCCCCCECAARSADSLACSSSTCSHPLQSCACTRLSPSTVSCSRCASANTGLLGHRVSYIFPPVFLLDVEVTSRSSTRHRTCFAMEPMNASLARLACINRQKQAKRQTKGPSPLRRLLRCVANTRVNPSTHCVLCQLSLSLCRLSHFRRHSN